MGHISITQRAAGDRFVRVAARLHALGRAEKIALGFFLYVALASVLLPVPAEQCLAVWVLNCAVAAVLVLLDRVSGNGGSLPGNGPGKRGEWKHGSRIFGTIRDWLPCVLIVLAYRESGLIYTPDPTHRLDTIFEQWDLTLFENPWVSTALAWGSPWLERYLEFSYLACYPIVPLGFSVICFARPNPSQGGGRLDRSRMIDEFWTVLLMALFCCYALYPFFPATPPRLLFQELPGPSLHPFLRKLNFWMLDEYGVPASMFPSGHVAVVTAIALSLRTYLPRWGIFFAWAAGSVAVATVIERYHYGADALAGVLIGLGAFYLSKRLHDRLSVEGTAPQTPVERIG